MAKLFLQNLFEFLYDYISKKGRTFLFDRLDREDFQKVKTEAKIKRFVEYASLEDKVIMASKLGLRVALMMWDEETEKTKSVQDAYIEYLKVPGHELQRTIIKDKAFVTMDIDFIKSIQLASKASNSPNYSLNRKYLQVKETSTYRTRTLVDKLQAEAGLNWYVATILHALNLEAALEVFKIDLDQLKILLFLHNCPNGALRQALKDRVEKTGRITFLLNDLRSMNMVKFDPGNEDVIFIHTYGIIILDQIISKFP